MTAAAGLPGIAATALGLLLFVALLVALRWRRPAEDGGTRDGRSMVGIAVQACAFMIVAGGGARVTLDPLGGPALAAGAITATTMVAALALFLWATTTMGRNWSLVARTRSDHRLVTGGPFARVRHPIYTALALVMIAMAVGMGHLWRLPPALAVYALGTWLRVRTEERLLHAMFGAAYRDYAARVPRFLPGLL